MLKTIIPATILGSNLGDSAHEQVHRNAKTCIPATIRRNLQFLCGGAGFCISCPCAYGTSTKTCRGDSANIIKKHCLEQGWRETDHTQRCAGGTCTKAFRWDCVNSIKKHCLGQGWREMDHTQKYSDGTSGKVRNCQTR